MSPGFSILWKKSGWSRDISFSDEWWHAAVESNILSPDETIL